MTDLQREKEWKDKHLLLQEQEVLQMTEEYTGKWHHIYSKSFTLTELMKLLLKNNPVPVEMASWGEGAGPVT